MNAVLNLLKRKDQNHRSTNGNGRRSTQLER